MQLVDVVEAPKYRKIKGESFVYKTTLMNLKGGKNVCVQTVGHRRSVDLFRVELISSGRFFCIFCFYKPHVRSHYEIPFH